MEIKEAIRSALKELVLPELDEIKEENREIKALLSITNKRLDDVNLHLADQSRRIDDTNKRIDDTNKRIDDTNKRVDAIREELTQHIASIREELTRRIDSVREELTRRIESIHADLIHRSDETNQGLYRLYEVIVRKDEHVMVAERVAVLEREVSELKRRLAA